MTKLEQLVNELLKNPNVIHEIENEVNRLASLDDCSALYDLLESKVPSIQVFLCKVIDLRIKRKIASLNLQDEILFTTRLIQVNPSNQSIEVFSQLGLYCCPTFYGNFMDEVVLNMKNKIGYQILVAFLEQINSSANIDDKRRSELKKAISIIFPHIEQNFRPEFAKYIIKIYTELLKILPKTFDYSLVFEKAQEYKDESLVFIIEGIHYLDKNKVADILNVLRIDPLMIQTLSTFKLTKLNNPEKVYEYVFKGLEDPECLTASIDFWQKLFSSQSHANILNPVLNKVIEAYMTITEEELKDEVNQHIFGFFTIVSKNYPYEIKEYIKVTGDILPYKITSNFIQKLSKNEYSMQLLSDLHFKIPYLECLVNYLRKDPKTPLTIPNLDFTNKDDIKLTLQIISDFDFTADELNNILKMCDDSLVCNEIKVECCLKLGIEDSLDGPWDMNKIIKIFYYLKKPEKYMKYKDVYYNVFVQSAPFDICFAILEKLGPVPNFILQCIYDKLDKYPFIDLACFNNDLLHHLNDPKPFIEKEVYRLVMKWDTIAEYKDYYMAFNSLMSFFASRLDSYGLGLIDYLIELIQIDSPLVINKVISLLNCYKGNYNTKKALYYLIKAYNKPNLMNSQSLISGAITNCLYQEDGAIAFNEILGIDIHKCCEVKSQIAKSNKKSAHNLVRDLIKDYRALPFNKMFTDEFRVTKQNFLPPKSANKPNDYSLPRDFI